MKCLVIEDSKADAELMKTFIKKSRPKSQTTICNNFISGAKNLYHNSYDVIFLDLNLPDNWGISSIKEIKKYARKTPIIVTTGFASKTTIDEAKKAGAALVFEKRELTTSTIANLIGEKEMVG